MALVYNSGAVSGLSPASPVTINHNLGYIPSVYSVQSVVDGQPAGWEPMDPNNPMGPSPVYVESFDTSKAVIKMLEGYTYSGDILLVCYHG